MAINRRSFIARAASAIGTFAAVASLKADQAPVLYGVDLGSNDRTAILVFNGQTIHTYDGSQWVKALGSSSREALDIHLGQMMEG